MPSNFWTLPEAPNLWKVHLVIWMVRELQHQASFTSEKPLGRDEPSDRSFRHFPFQSWPKPKVTWAVYSILLGQNLPHCRMWWTRHQGRSRWSRSGRERWRGWGTHRRRTEMRRSCGSPWHWLSNFENLVGNTLDIHSEGNAYVFSSNQGISWSPWVRSLHFDQLVYKKEHF